MEEKMIMAEYERWLLRVPGGSPLKEELLAIRGDEAAIRERFYKTITFGTAGLRGISGAGTNRMNRYTVGRATQGIADYILARGYDGAPVVLAYDCRYHSKEYAELAARILTGNGIRTVLFPSMRPTPELSFAIRNLGAVTGINMTASHNPKEYNGYKVYWSDGAQISGEVADGMTEAIGALDLFDAPEMLDLAEAKKRGLLRISDEGIDQKYTAYVLSMAQRPDAELDRDIPIVYTPLNGAGKPFVEEVFRRRGFSGLAIVPEQAAPDPEFTTVGYPNPEDPKAFALAEKLGEKIHAAVLIATDPDSDRMAIEIPERDGKFHFLGGNETGAMLIAYMAESGRISGRLPANAAMIKSIVTGDMGAAICRSYGIRVFEALTGFKNICGKIPAIEKLGYRCFFSYEESIGCAPGDQVRDKDGITAAMLIAEMTAWYHKKGMTLEDALTALYEKYGYYAESPVSLILKGEDGEARIRAIMEKFRRESPETFGGRKVVKKIDYLNGYEDIPASNVLRFDLGDGVWFAVRPSGTEPKLKFYFYAVAENKAEAERLVAAVREDAMALTR